MKHPKVKERSLYLMLENRWSSRRLPKLGMNKSLPVKDVLWTVLYEIQNPSLLTLNTCAAPTGGKNITEMCTKDSQLKSTCNVKAMS